MSDGCDGTLGTEVSLMLMCPKSFMKDNKLSSSPRHILSRGVDAIMNITNQSQECHSERSEESLSGYMQILRFAQNDRSLPILVVKVHHRVPTF